VKDLSTGQKMAVENLLGRPVSEHETVNVQAFEPAVISGQRRQEIAEALRQYFAEVDAKRQPVSAAEADGHPDRGNAKQPPGLLSTTVRIVLDTTILVRANENSQGVARQLFRDIVTGPDTLLLCNEILFELARLLRYPRMQALYGLSEARVYDYIGFLREVSVQVTLNPVSLRFAEYSDTNVGQASA